MRQTLYERYRNLADNLYVLPAHYMGINEMSKAGRIMEKFEFLYDRNHGLNIDSEEEFRKRCAVR